MGYVVALERSLQCSLGLPRDHCKRSDVKSSVCSVHCACTVITADAATKAEPEHKTRDSVSNVPAER